MPKRKSVKKIISIATDIECSTLFSKIGGDLLEMSFVEILEGYEIGRSICINSRATSDLYFNEESEEIHGISFWKAMEFQPRADSIEEFQEWIGPLGTAGPLPLIYHANGNFDHKWLVTHFMKEAQEHYFRNLFPSDMTISTLALSRKNIKHIKNHKIWNKIKKKYYGPYALPNVCAHYKQPLEHHKSLSDAMASAVIYCNIMKKIDTWTGELDFG